MILPTLPPVPVNATCTSCGQRIEQSAIVPAFGKPDGWQFYGEQGQRWQVCDVVDTTARRVHFKKRQAGRVIHCMAIIKAGGE